MGTSGGPAKTSEKGSREPPHFGTGSKLAPNLLAIRNAYPSPVLRR
jgi:hypothetical protein